MENLLIEKQNLTEIKEGYIIELNEKINTLRDINTRFEITLEKIQNNEDVDKDFFIRLKDKRKYLKQEVTFTQAELSIVSNKLKEVNVKISALEDISQNRLLKKIIIELVGKEKYIELINSKQNEL